MLVKKSTTGLGMTILIGLAVSQIVYNAIFHPVRSYKLWVYKQSWY
jgi:hypothetical protein